MIRHMCLDVRGALNWPRRMQQQMASSFIVEGRRIQNADDVREFLMDCLVEGKEVLPMAECEGFDFKAGCPGHPSGCDLNPTPEDPDECPF